jgi:hypothetical protein
MREPSLSTAAFPTSHCETCDRDVLTYIGLGADGAEQRFCVHCDAPAAAELRWISAGELEQEGYYFGSEPPKSAGAGCSSGCGSCSTRKN